MNGLLHRIDCIQTALGAESGSTVALQMDRSNFGGHRIDAWPSSESGLETIDVPLMRLDDVAPDLDPECDLIFMDVQGFEGQVLRGCRNSIRANVPIVMEFTPDAMISFGGLAVVSEELADYQRFYDLRLDKPVGRPLSELTALALQYSSHPSGYTDILVC